MDTPTITSRTRGTVLTLILLGHEVSRTDVHGSVRYQYEEAGPMGLFAVADSALTRKDELEDGRAAYRTLLTGLEKVHELNIRVRRPDILRNGHFQGYLSSPAYLGKAFLAFAGNANSAHHALNAIRRDLAELVVSYRFKSQGGEPTGLILLRGRDRNPMREGGVSFDEETFFGPEVDQLSKADNFAQVVAQATETALQSVVVHCQSDKDLKLANAAFAFGVWCPVLKKHSLYHLEPKREMVLGQVRLVAKPRAVPEHEVLALGTQPVIEALPIQETYNTALAETQSPAEALLALMDSAIDRDHTAFTGYPINRPLLRIQLKENDLRRL